MRTLLLNADYSPYDIISWKRAFGLLFADSHPIIILSEYNHCIRDGKGNLYAVPAVISLKQYQNRINLPAPYSKLAVFLRDLFRCQYCGRKLERETCTIDHVIPKHYFRKNNSQIRFSSFENTVTACKRCNSKKGHRKPEEIGMKLLAQPKRPTRAMLFKSKLYLTKIPKEWEKYLDDKVSQKEATQS